VQKNIDKLTSIVYNKSVSNETKGEIQMDERKDIPFPLSHPLLRDIDPVLWERLSAQKLCPIHRFGAGENIRTPRTESDGLGILLNGSAIAYTPHPIKKVMLRTFSAGAVFGISDWYADPKAGLSRIEAKEETDVLTIRPAGVRLLLEESRSFREHYISFLTGRIRFLNQKIEYLTAGSAEIKLSHYLLSLNESQTVTLPISMSALAEMLDLGRASLYRAFDTLTEDGFISKQGKTITLHNRAGMEIYYHRKAITKETLS
jgi:CRP-like cAMP-binding protein